MSTETERHHVVIDLSIDEQWVVHHVMLDSIGLASGEPIAETPPDWVVGILRKLEAGDHDFSPMELDHICHELAKYTRADGTTDTDREVAQAVLDRSEELLAGEDVEHYQSL